MASLALCIATYVLLRNTLFLSGDALVDFDYYYSQLNHLVQYGSFAFWDPYLYLGQPVPSHFLLRVAASPDPLIGWTGQLQFLDVYLLSRSIEIALLFAGFVLLATELRIKQVVAVALGIPLSLSYIVTVQTWPLSCASGWIWILYFLVRYAGDSGRSRDAMAVILLLGVFISQAYPAGMLMALPFLCVAVVATGFVPRLLKDKHLTPLLALGFLLLLARGSVVLIDDNELYHHNRQSGSYLTHNPEQFANAINAAQSTVDELPISLPMAPTFDDDQKEGASVDMQRYVLEDANGFVSISAFLLAILGLARCPKGKRWIAFSALVALLYFYFPSWIGIFKFSDLLSQALNFRYFVFVLSLGKLYLFLLAAFAIDHWLTPADHRWSGALFAMVAFATGVYTGYWPALILAAVLAASSFNSLAAFIWLVPLLVLLEVIKFNVVHLGHSHPTYVSLSTHQLQKRTPWRDLVFFQERNLNTIFPKFALQRSSQQMTVPFPVMEGGQSAGWRAGFIDRCYKALLRERSIEEVEKVNGMKGMVLTQNAAGKYGTITGQDVKFFNANRLSILIESPQSSVRWNNRFKSSWHVDSMGKELRADENEDCSTVVMLSGDEKELTFSYRPRERQLALLITLLSSILVFSIKLHKVATARSPESGNPTIHRSNFST